MTAPHFTMRLLSSVVALVGALSSVQAQSTTAFNWLADPSFIGYYIASGGTTPLTAGDYWLTAGTYAGDCPNSTLCSIPTACLDNTVSYNGGSTYVCTSGASCVSFTIFQTYPDGLPSATNVGCREDWTLNTLYRVVEASTTAAASTSSSSVTTTASTPTSTGAPSTTASSPTQSATNSGFASSSSSSSEAWIAGAVIGPVAAVAALAAAAFWFGRRGMRARDAAAAAAAAGSAGGPDQSPSNMTPYDPYLSPAQAASELDTSMAGSPPPMMYHQVPPDPQMAEMPAGDPTKYGYNYPELPSN